MTLDQLIRSLSPEVYQNLRRAIELGKWPDGRRLTDEQRELCMEAVLKYEAMHDVAEQERIGFIDRSKAEQTSCNTSHDHDHEGGSDQTRPVKWVN